MKTRYVFLLFLAISMTSIALKGSDTRLTESVKRRSIERKLDEYMQNVPKQEEHFIPWMQNVGNTITQLQQEGASVSVKKYRKKFKKEIDKRSRSLGQEPGHIFDKYTERDLLMFARTYLLPVDFEQYLRRMIGTSGAIQDSNKGEIFKKMQKIEQKFSGGIKLRVKSDVEPAKPYYLSIHDDLERVRSEMEKAQLVYNVDYFDQGSEKAVWGTTFQSRQKDLAIALSDNVELLFQRFINDREEDIDKVMDVLKYGNASMIALNQDLFLQVYFALHDTVTGALQLDDKGRSLLVNSLYPYKDMNLAKQSSSLAKTFKVVDKLLEKLLSVIETSSKDNFVKIQTLADRFFDSMDLFFPQEKYDFLNLYTMPGWPIRFGQLSYNYRTPYRKLKEKMKVD